MITSLCQTTSLKNEFYRLTNDDWVFVDIANHSLLTDEHELLPDHWEPAYEPIYYHIIEPLHNIATKFHDQFYVNKDALNTVSKPKLTNFQINFSRFACECQPGNISHVPYAMICMTYDLHLQEARRLIPKSHETNTLELQLDERLRLKAKQSLVSFPNIILTSYKCSHFLPHPGAGHTQNTLR